MKLRRRQTKATRWLQPRPLTVREREQLRLINGALDTLTEFGVETASREHLMQRIGGAVTVLHLLKDHVCGT